MPWIYLILAGLLEVVWAVGLKYADGFTRLVPSLITIAGMIASMWLLALAMRQLPLGTTYAIWTGIGALGSFILGIILFGEAVSVARVVSAGLLIIGLLGLKFSAG